MTLSPFERTTCIHCGQTFMYKDSCVVSTNNAPESTVRAGTVLHESPVLHKPRRPRGLERLKRRVPPPLPEIRNVWYTNPSGGDRLHGTEVLAEFACPNPKCRKPISSEREYLIALVGDTQSGKSHYIASLIDQVIHASTLAGLQCSSHARGDSYERYLQHYYNPLVIRKEAILGNQPGNQAAQDKKNAPLSFTLVLERPGTSFRREVAFTVFDWAGEMLADTGRRVLTAKYVNEAAAIIFFVDPMTLPGFVRHLSPELQQKAQDEHSRIGHTISSVVVTHNRQHGPRPDMRPLRIPVSITLSKSDLAEEVCKALRFTPTFLADDRHTDGYDLLRAQEVSREVRDFLEAVQGHEALSREGLLRNVMYHAVSATGREESGGKYPDYQPIRCLDPFLWILSQWGVLN